MREGSLNILTWINILNMWQVWNWTEAEAIGYLIDTCRMQDKKRILMIGDREHDVLGAKQEGLDCMGVLYGFGNREELEKAGAVYVAGTPEDIAGIILK